MGLVLWEGFCRGPEGLRTAPGARRAAKSQRPSAAWSTSRTRSPERSVWESVVRGKVTLAWASVANCHMRVSRAKLDGGGQECRAVPHIVVAGASGRDCRPQDPMR